MPASEVEADVDRTILRLRFPGNVKPQALQPAAESRASSSLTTRPVLLGAT